MRACVDGAGAWTFAGGADIALAARSGDAPVDGVLRTSLTIAQDRRSMTALWERADGGTPGFNGWTCGFTLIDPVTRSGGP